MTPRIKFLWNCFCMSIGVAAANVVGWAQSEYRLPPADVVDIIAAQPEPTISLSPDGKWMLFLEQDALPAIEDLARRMLQLAGTRIDPVAQAGFRTDFIRGWSVRSTTGDNVLPVVPRSSEVRISQVRWSPDSRHVAWVQVTPQGSELWLVSAADWQKPRRLTDRLSTVLCEWSFAPQGDKIICAVVPENRGPEPAAPRKPAGPNIQESLGNTTPVRTFQDLLSNAHDEALFEHYATVQIAALGFDGSQQLLGDPGLFSDIGYSPDGEWLLVNKLLRPFSYLFPYSSFPQRYELWNPRGELAQVVAEMPLEENIPIEGVPTGPRGIRWAANRPAQLVWWEALDGGDPKTKVPHRDRLMAWGAPFTEAPVEWLRVQHRGAGVSFFADPQMISCTEIDRDRRWLRTMARRLDQPAAEPIVLDDRSQRDQYGDPGRPVGRLLESGFSVMRQDGDWIYLAGPGATPEGNLPFLDRRNLVTGVTERMWRCEPGWQESVVQVLQSGADTRPILVTRRESPTAPPNYFRYDCQSSEREALTDFADPTPQIRGIQKKLVKYQRADGVPLSATLYLPANYQPGTRLPLLIWAYPLEFSDASTAGQVSASPSQFTRITGLSHLILLTQGYAIMDNATMPVVGDPETMNDTFVEQIVASAQAAIDKAVELGVADRNRVCVGGHSYGAFMTANLLAHCDLFRAGVARSGAYNRTLTPFGFQSERRPFWEAKEIYMNISPFTHADKIKTPLLLIHGENDNNPGTFPVQSQRLFQAIKGNGGTVRLVMLPHESHGYRARESVLHTHAETIEWLNRYVRDASQPDQPASPPPRPATGASE